MNVPPPEQQWGNERLDSLRGNKNQLQRRRKERQENEKAQQRSWERKYVEVVVEGHVTKTEKNIDYKMMSCIH
jgi:hypothetical protein